MKAIGVGVVVEGAALSVVSVTHPEYNRLTIFLIGSVLARDRITTGSIFWAIERYAVDGDGDFTKGCSAFVVTVRLGAVRGVMATGCIIDRRTGNRPFVVLGSCAIIALRTGQCGFKIMIR